MRLSRLLLAALLLPSLALAQEHQRDSWYIGFGLGTGSGRVTAEGETRTFADLNIGTPVNVALNFKVGATIAPTMLVGFDVTAVRAQSEESGISTGVQVTNYDAVLTYFPWREGFFLRGGAGLSVLTLDVDFGGSSGVSTDTGVNLLGGVGYAFWLGQKFNLTANLDVSLQKYGGGAGEPDSSGLWALWLGFDWY